MASHNFVVVFATSGYRAAADESRAIPACWYHPSEGMSVVWPPGYGQDPVGEGSLVTTRGKLPQGQSNVTTPLSLVIS